MSQDPKGDAPASAADPIAQLAQSQKNSHAELDRKIANAMNVIQEQNKFFQTIIQQQTAGAKSATPTIPNDKKLVDLMYDNPEEYARQVAKIATAEALAASGKANDVANRRANILNQLVGEYPELADQQHDLTKRAVEIYQELSEEERVSPNSYKLSVREAAAEFGVLPASKRARPTNSDDFTFSGGSGGRNPPPGGKAKISDRTLAFAQAMGMNTNDPKYIERLEKSAQRKDWTRGK